MDIKTVYRGRRWNDSSATDQMVDLYREGKVSEEAVLQASKTSQDGWKTWFEPCPVTHVSENGRTIMVVSETIEGGPFYPGGNFLLRVADLEADGKQYHSRYGEYFYLELPQISEPWFTVNLANKLPPNR